jgi:lipoic acid synthetase
MFDAGPKSGEDSPVPRLPPWIRQPLRTDQHYGAVRQVLSKNALHTVCQSAHCPNQQECWSRGTATFMILGNTCTRACQFCNITTGRPAPPDAAEPRHVAAAAQQMRLRHVVITSVTRDDLPDGGAAHFAATLVAVRAALPMATLEVLTPDFGGDTAAIKVVLAARPDVFNHNLETVRRLQGEVRPHASYARSLGVLRHAAAQPGHAAVKSGVMVGLGETDDELLDAFRDLRAAGCELLTVGQYLRPRHGKRPVARFVAPEAFARLADAARAMGFRNVAAGPLVRSSYRAEELTQPAVAEGLGR